MELLGDFYKMISLRDEIIDILKDVYYNNDQAYPFDENDADRILTLFEKRIDYVEQRAIEYITCRDEGDPTATRELAEIMNDHNTENCWRGMKIIINDFRKMLKE